MRIPDTSRTIRRHTHVTRVSSFDVKIKPPLENRYIVIAPSDLYRRGGLTGLWGHLWRRVKEKNDIRGILEAVKVPADRKPSLRDEAGGPLIREVPSTRDTEVLLGRIGDSRAIGAIACRVQRTGEGEDL